MASAMPERMQSVQQAFSDYIRNPSAASLPEGVAKPRMDMYRELFFNNINSFLSGGFPVLKQILSEQQWLAMTQDFFASYVCTTPYFSEIGAEFLTYLQSQPPVLATYPPFLLELAHYEWVEMALSIAQEDAPERDAVVIQNPCDQVLALSPLAWPLVYRFPVQRLSPQFQPLTPPVQPTHLVVFRDNKDEVRFLEISPLTFTLLQMLQAHPAETAEQYLQRIADINPDLDMQVLVSGGLQIINDMLQLGIIHTPV